MADRAFHPIESGLGVGDGIRSQDPESGGPQHPADANRILTRQAGRTYSRSDLITVREFG
ncbi:MAG: hypothetical protein H7338_21340 [Candidatus Sericytochromatia bacterium]|nr:hypothetical protein [Candidatus Sericytochromatia bacterium]